MIAQQGQAFGIQFVDAARTFAAIAHQAGVFQHAQVLRNRRPGHREPRGELVHCQRLIAQHFEDGQAGGIAESGQAVLYVSIHLR